MVHVQTGNMLDVVVEGKSIGLKQRDSDHRKHDVIWLPDPESLALVLLAEIKRLRPDSVESKDDRFQAGADAARREDAGIGSTVENATKVTDNEHHDYNEGYREAARWIAEAILSRVGQPVQNDQGG